MHRSLAQGRTNAALAPLDASCRSTPVRIANALVVRRFLRFAHLPPLNVSSAPPGVPMLRKLFCLGPPPTTDAPSTSERVPSTAPQPEARPDQSPLGALRSIPTPSPLSTPRRANARRAALPRDSAGGASNPEQQVAALRGLQHIDMAELAGSIDGHLMMGGPLPQHIQLTLDMAGVPRDTTHARHGFRGSSPLVLLRRALTHEPELQVQNLRTNGIDMADLVRTIRRHRSRGAPIPNDLAARLSEVGIDIHERVAQSGRETPLDRLYQALRNDPHTQVAILMARGNDPSALQHAIGLHFGTNAEFPVALAADLRAAGVRIDAAEGINRANPLVRLQGVLISMSRQRAAASPRPTASPARASGSQQLPWAMARSPRAGASTSASGSTTPGRGWAARNENLGNVPEREDHDTNLQYAMRVHQTRPDLSARQLAHISGADRGDLRRAIAEAAAAPQRWARMAGELCHSLQTMDSDTAEAKDFVDGETHCMFGGTLSLNNSDQRVVALSAQRLSSGVPDNLAFVDLDALVHYVHDSRKHPLTNELLAEYQVEEDASPEEVAALEAAASLEAVASLQKFVLRITPPQPDQD